MARDERTYIRLHDGMPDHPKVEPLSDAAFRLLVTTWCWSSRHLTDGRVPDAIWRRRGTPRARRELLAAGLAESTEDGIQMHDYAEHQRTAEEVATIKDRRRTAATAGNHQRWHVDRGITDPTCSHCAIPSGSQERPPPESAIRSGSDRKSSPETETETETEKGKDYQPREPKRTASDEPPGQPGRAEALLAEHRAVAGRTNPRAVTELGGHIADLVRAGYSDDEIRAGLRTWRSRGVRPSSLPDLVDYAARNGAGTALARAAPTTTRPSTTDQRVTAGLELAARYAAEGR